MKKILIIIPILCFLFSINFVSADEVTKTYYTSDKWQIFDTTNLGTDYVPFQYENASHNKAKLWIYNHEDNDYILYYSFNGQYGAVKAGESKYISADYSSNSLNSPKFYWCYEDTDLKKYIAVEAAGRVCIYENGALADSASSFVPSSFSIFTFVSSFIECILSVLSKIITFITANGHEIILVGVIGALVFAILGAARSFLKGV